MCRFVNFSFSCIYIIRLHGVAVNSELTPFIIEEPLKLKRKLEVREKKAINEWLRDKSREIQTLARMAMTQESSTVQSK